jgi:hypothetical protein
MSEQERRPEIVLMKPSKPVSQMTADELHAFVDRFVDALRRRGSTGEDAGPESSPSPGGGRD